jgi:RimK family alpha-L-glutamate ligase
MLSARPDLQVNARFAAAAAARQVVLDLVDGLRVVTCLSRDLRLELDGRDLLAPPPQVMLVRVGNWRPESLLAALEIAERAGIPTPNPAPSIRLGRDHWRSLVALRDAGLPVPDSLVGSDPESLAAQAVSALGLPVVVKQRRSRMGVGVIRCDGLDHLEAVLDSLWRVGDEVLVQRFVAADGVSARLVVAGGRVIAAARFRARKGEWRSNGARGGRAEPYHPSEHEHALAVAAARAVGLGICGVDVLPSPQGPMVCEVNPTPGFLKVERASGVDVAGALLDHLLQPLPAASL